MKKKISVIIADDHKIFAEGLKSMLESIGNIDVSAILNDGKSLISHLENNTCDVILLDINMPEMDGIDAANIIYHKYPEIKTLVLTMYDRPEFFKKLTTKLARGYILKNADPEELMEAINTVYAGKKYFSKAVLDKMNDANAQIEKNDFDDGYNNKLSSREREILKYISAGKSNPEIAEILFLSPHTVDTHRKNIMHKLDVHSTAELVKYAIQLGLNVD